MEHITLRQSAIAQQLSCVQSNKELQLYYQPIWEISKKGQKKLSHLRLCCVGIAAIWG
jgi:EAL domain-containing protein (putative c-di-GMP-specific phosphodiesterase class I)